MGARGPAATPCARLSNDVRGRRRRASGRAPRDPFRRHSTARVSTPTAGAMWAPCIAMRRRCDFLFSLCAMTPPLRAIGRRSASCQRDPPPHIPPPPASAALRAPTPIVALAPPSLAEPARCPLAPRWRCHAHAQGAARARRVRPGKRARRTPGARRERPRLLDFRCALRALDRSALPFRPRRRPTCSAA